jgi:CRP/FNR family transcriptional regulator/CRP/FNR family cyclic AMP-dependent transcriptional regulator
MSNPLINQHLVYFKKVSLFNNLDEDQIKKIMTIMTLSEIKKNEMVTREGEHGDSMFILLKGEVEISKSLYISPLSSENSLQEKALNRLTEQQHSFLGEMALFLDKPERSASIRAVKPCTIAAIQKKELLKILDKDTTIASIIYKNIAAELCKRLIKSNKDILKLTTAFSLALEGD